MDSRAITTGSTSLMLLDPAYGLAIGCGYLERLRSTVGKIPPLR